MPNRALAYARKKAEARVRCLDSGGVHRTPETGEQCDAPSASRQAFAELFDRSRCAVKNCDRQPAKGSRFCGCCKEDRRAGRVVVFRGGEMLPARTESTKGIYGGAATYDWPGVVQ